MKFLYRCSRQITILIIVIFLFISLLFLSFLNSTQNLISKENIIEMVKKIDFQELLGKEAKEKIYETLEQTGIPTEYVDSVLEDEQLKEYMGIYVAEGIEYLIYEEKKPSLSASEMTLLLSNSFDRVILELETEGIDISEYFGKQEQEQIHQKIEYYVPEVMEHIPEAEAFIEQKIEENGTLQEGEKKLAEFRRLIHDIQLVYEFKPLLSVAILIQIGFIVILKIRHFRFIKWLALPFLGIFLALTYVLKQFPIWIQTYYPNELSFLKGILDDITLQLMNSWKTTSNLCGMIALLFFLLQIICIGIYCYQNRREKDMAKL